MRRVGPVRLSAKGPRGPKSRIPWPKVRGEYEGGAKIVELAQKYKIGRRTIELKIKNQEWKRDSDERINALAIRKAAETVADPNAKEARINVEATARAAVLNRHQRECSIIGDRILRAVQAHDAAKLVADPGRRLAAKRDAFEDLKAAKISAEAMEIKQRMERKAHSIDAKDPGEEGGGGFDPNNPPPFTWQIDRPGGDPTLQ